LPARLPAQRLPDNGLVVKGILRPAVPARTLAQPLDLR